MLCLSGSWVQSGQLKLQERSLCIMMPHLKCHVFLILHEYMLFCRADRSFKLHQRQGSHALWSDNAAHGHMLSSQSLLHARECNRDCCMVSTLAILPL